MVWSESTFVEKLITMKKIFYLICTVAVMSSCATAYETNYNVNGTQIEISSNNFEHLGSFTGSATEKRTKASIKNMEGLISRAKKELLENIKSAGIEMNSSKVLINMNVDVIKNYKRVTVTLSADLIYFTK